MDRPLVPGFTRPPYLSTSYLGAYLINPPQVEHLPEPGETCQKEDVADGGSVGSVGCKVMRTSCAVRGTRRLNTTASTLPSLLRLLFSP